MRAQTRIFSVATTIACFALASPGFAQAYVGGNNQSAVQVDLGALNALPGQPSAQAVPHRRGKSDGDSSASPFQTTVIGGGGDALAPVHVVSTKKLGKKQAKHKTKPAMTADEMNAMQLKALPPLSPEVTASSEPTLSMPGSAPQPDVPAQSPASDTHSSPAIVPGRPPQSDGDSPPPVDAPETSQPFDKPPVPSSRLDDEASAALPPPRDDYDEKRRQPPAVPTEPLLPSAGPAPGNAETAAKPGTPASTETLNRDEIARLLGNEPVVITLPKLPSDTPVTTQALNHAELMQILAEAGETMSAEAAPSVTVTTQKLNQDELTHVLTGAAPAVEKAAPTPPPKEETKPVAQKPAPVTPVMPPEVKTQLTQTKPSMATPEKVTTESLNRDALLHGPAAATPLVEKPAMDPAPAPVVAAPVEKSVKETAPAPVAAPVITKPATIKSDAHKTASSVSDSRVTTDSLNRAALLMGPAEIPSAPQAAAIEPPAPKAEMPAPQPEARITTNDLKPVQPVSPPPAVEKTQAQPLDQGLVSPAPIAAPPEPKPAKQASVAPAPAAKTTTENLNRAELKKGPAETAESAKPLPALSAEPAAAPSLLDQKPVIAAPPPVSTPESKPAPVAVPKLASIVTPPPAPAPVAKTTTDSLNQAELKKASAPPGETSSPDFTPPAPVAVAPVSLPPVPKAPVASPPPVIASAPKIEPPKPAPQPVQSATVAPPAPPPLPQATKAPVTTPDDLIDETAGPLPPNTRIVTDPNRPLPPPARFSGVGHYDIPSTIELNNTAPAVAPPAASQPPAQVAAPVQQVQTAPALLDQTPVVSMAKPAATIAPPSAPKTANVTTEDLNRAQLMKQPEAAAPSVADNTVQPPVPVNPPAHKAAPVAPAPSLTQNSDNTMPLDSVPAIPVAPPVEKTTPVKPLAKPSVKPSGKPNTASTQDLNQAELEKIPAVPQPAALDQMPAPKPKEEPKKLALAPQTPATPAASATDLNSVELAKPSPAQTSEALPLDQIPAPAKPVEAAPVQPVTPPAPKAKPAAPAPKAIDTTQDLNKAELSKTPQIAAAPEKTTQALPLDQTPTPAPIKTADTSNPQPATAPKLAAPVLPKTEDTTGNLNHAELAQAAPHEAAPHEAVPLDKPLASPPAAIEKATQPAEPAHTTPAPVLKPNDDLAVTFTPGSTALSQEATARLDAMVGHLKENPDLRIELRSLASAEKGSTSNARRTSLSRALAIKSYLQSQSIAEDRIDVRALGAPPGEAPTDRVDFFLMR